MESTVPAPAPAAPAQALDPRPLVAPKSDVGGSTLDSSASGPPPPSQPSTPNPQLAPASPPGSAPPPAPGSKLDVGRSAFDVQPPADPQPSFPRSPGETPRAYAAFMAWFNLGQARSLQAVSDKIGEHLSTLKNWSAKYEWFERLQVFQQGVLQQQASDDAQRQRLHAANWAGRLEHFREQEWDAAQKLLAAAHCFLESFGDEALQKMTLSQVSRALTISSKIGRSALLGAELPPSTDRALSPIQQQMLDAIARVYGTVGTLAGPARASTASETSPPSIPTV